MVCTPWSRHGHRTVV